MYMQKKKDLLRLNIPANALRLCFDIHCQWKFIYIM